MGSIKKFLNKYAYFLLHFISTGVISVGFAYLLGPDSDYTFAINSIIGLLVIYFIYRMIIKKKYRDSILKIICAIVILISTNHLYSYENVISLIPWIDNVNKFTLVLIAVVVVILVSLILVLVRYVDLNPSRLESNSIEPSVDRIKSVEKPIGLNRENKFRMFSLLRVAGVVGIITIVFAISMWLYFKLDFPQIINHSTQMELSTLLSALIGFGASMLFLIFGIMIIILALIELTRFLYRRLLLFREERKSGATDNNHTLAYVFSILIVVAMLFAAYKIGDFTINDFTDMMVGEDYLAVPLVLLVGIVLLVLLVRLTHGILLLVMRSEPIDVKKFVEENKNILNIKEDISDITKSIVHILFGTIKSVFQFIEFIPNFFVTLSAMVLSDEDDEDDNKE